MLNIIIKSRLKCTSSDKNNKNFWFLQRIIFRTKKIQKFLVTYFLIYLNIKNNINMRFYLKIRYLFIFIGCERRVV